MSEYWIQHLIGLPVMPNIVELMQHKPKVPRASSFNLRRVSLVVPSKTDDKMFGKILTRMETFVLSRLSGQFGIKEESDDTCSLSNDSVSETNRLSQLNPSSPNKSLRTANPTFAKPKSQRSMSQSIDTRSNLENIERKLAGLLEDIDLVIQNSQVTTEDLSKLGAQYDESDLLGDGIDKYFATEHILPEGMIMN